MSPEKTITLSTQRHTYNQVREIISDDALRPSDLLPCIRVGKSGVIGYKTKSGGVIYAPER